MRSFSLNTCSWSFAQFKWICSEKDLVLQGPARDQSQFKQHFRRAVLINLLLWTNQTHSTNRTLLRSLSRNPLSISVFFSFVHKFNRASTSFVGHVHKKKKGSVGKKKIQPWSHIVEMFLWPAHLPQQVSKEQIMYVYYTHCCLFQGCGKIIKLK